MKKSTKLMIEIVGVVVVFAIASIAYNKLNDGSISTSYVPTINTEKAQAIVGTNDSNLLEEKGESVEVVESNNSDQTDLNYEEDLSAADMAAKSEVAEQASQDVAPSNPIMPDIPVVMYPFKEESTFWDVIPKGKPVVINLFAAWCPPCKAEMPYFVEARNTYKDDVTFVFFDSLDGSRETEATLKAFADKTFEEGTLIVMDPGYLGSLFNVNSIPLTILLNDKGEIVNGFSGSVNEETLIGAIEELLN
jgi:thiol-disulfide isomerase/thioredoxin